MTEQINLAPLQAEGDLVNDPTLGKGEVLASTAEIAEFLGNVKPMTEAEYDEYRQEDGNAAGGMKPYIGRADIMPYPGGEAELMIPQPGPLYHGETHEKAERRVSAHLTEVYLSSLNSGQTTVEGDRERQGSRVVITNHRKTETPIPDSTPNFLGQRLSAEPSEIEHGDDGKITSLTYEVTNPYGSTIVEKHYLETYKKPDGSDAQRKRINLLRRQKNRGPDVV